MKLEEPECLDTLVLRVYVALKINLNEQSRHEISHKALAKLSYHEVLTVPSMLEQTRHQGLNAYSSCTFAY